MLPSICLSNDKSVFNGLTGPDNPSGGLNMTSTIADGTVSDSGVVGEVKCQRPVLDAVSTGPRTYDIQLKRADGSVVDLTNVDSVRFVAKETEDATQFYINKEAEIVDGTAGRIKIVLTAADIPWAGVWLAAVLLLNSDGATLIQYDVWFHVKRGLLEADRQNVPISIMDVRLALMDRCAEDNAGLLDSPEFSDGEICWAIRRVVDEFNAFPPVLNHHNYTPATFPYRYMHTQAAVAELLRMAGLNLLRNKLDYNAGGLNVQDRARGPVYLQLSEAGRNEWKDWLKRTKYQLNAEACYSSRLSRIYY